MRRIGLDPETKAVTDEPQRDATAFFAAVDAAIAHDKTSGMLTAAEFDTMARHVAVLLDDAVACFWQSYGTCAFLSVTALEETAKTEMLCFRGRPRPEKNRRDRCAIMRRSTRLPFAREPSSALSRRSWAMNPAPACNRRRGCAEAGPGGGALHSSGSWGRHDGCYGH